MGLPGSGLSYWKAGVAISQGGEQGGVLQVAFRHPSLHLRLECEGRPQSSHGGGEEMVERSFSPCDCCSGLLFRNFSFNVICLYCHILVWS